MAKQTDRQPTLQEHFESIEAAIEDLEDGDLPLEDAFARYEAGLQALQGARVQLEGYQRRFEELRADAGDEQDD